MPEKAKIRKKAAGRAKKEPREHYHHGNLRAALIEAAMNIMIEQGPDALNMREAARRAGVSSGAPFRHFETRNDLMLAVAEEAFARFRREFRLTLEKAAGKSATVRFRAIAIAYLRWAIHSPAHFEILSTQRLFDLNGWSALQRDNHELIKETGAALGEVLRANRVPQAKHQLFRLAGRAMIYGFGRMKVDGHFPRWDVDERDAEEIGIQMIDLFIGSITRWKPR